MQKLVAKTAETFGRVDILINNAGTTVRKPVEQLTLAEWNFVMDTNLTSAFMCGQAVYPAMLKSGGGKIVNIGSMLSILHWVRCALCGKQGRHWANRPKPSRPDGRRTISRPMPFCRDGSRRI